MTWTQWSQTFEVLQLHTMNNEQGMCVCVYVIMTAAEDHKLNHTIKLSIKSQGFDKPVTQTGISSTAAAKDYNCCTCIITRKFYPQKYNQLI